MPSSRIIKSVFTLFVIAIGFVPPVLAEGQRLIIEDVTLIDGKGNPPRTHMSIVIEGSRIVDILHGSAKNIKADQRIAGRGKYLMPGLIDAHIHLKGAYPETIDGQTVMAGDREVGIKTLHGFLYSGVTSVYDSGNAPDYIFGLRRDERAGKITAPHIFASGAIVTYPGSHGSQFGGVLIDDWPEAKSTLDDYLARKPDLMKLTYEERGWGARPMIPLLPLDLMQKAIAYANDQGVRTTVHASNEYRARQALSVGIDNLSHPVIVGPITDEFARTLAAKQIPMVTTLTIGERYSRLAEHPEYLDQALYQATLTPDEIKKMKTETRKEYQERVWTWWMKIMTPIAQDNIRKVHEAGGILVLGSDQSSGPSSHRELELIVASGIPPLEAIRIGTLNAARFLGKDRDMGSIEIGKIADMVLLDADPTVDINNAKAISAVFKSGVRIDRSRLDLPVNHK
ncbi:MAG: hypothetical protein COB49_01435 [Alphaproteobacteria bacterium]|nr:MAG: hypothetical protein COB49_01435 [Alphaproteobacteria bacterium]